MLDVSIVMPVYNEGANIKVALERILTEVEGHYEILIVYDMDGDTTIAATREYIAEHAPKIEIRLVKNTLGRGALNALKMGFDEARADAVVVTMADLSDPPRIINAMLAEARNGADVVCASRYMRGGQHIGGPLVKRSLSRWAGRSMALISGIPTQDITNNFRLYKKSVLESVHIESTGGFEVAMEITLKAFYNGFRVAQVPTVWRDRVAGESRFQFRRWLPKYLRWYVFGVRHRFGI